MNINEDWVDQRNSSWNAPYTFSGKEKDAETGYGYFGARYYDSGLSIWLSVDPMSDKYPSMSPYNYCANNPVMLVDPDGMDLKLTGPLADLVYFCLRVTNTNIEFNNDEGVITAKRKTNKKGKTIPLTSSEEKVFNAINDHNVKIELECRNGHMKDIDGNLITNSNNGGVFLGNRCEGGIMEAKQGINQQNFLLSFDSDDFGALINHEITEAYFGAKYSDDNGGYAKPAFTNMFGDLISANPAYEYGHKHATIQPLSKLRKEYLKNQQQQQYRQQQINDSIYNANQMKIQFKNRKNTILN